MAFSPEEISQIIEEFFNTVGTRQYIGARYVPIFGRKNETSIQWDNSKPYEPLTIVLYQGNSYTSRQYVPAGVDILNQEFWANTGNYNSQVEQYRLEVIDYYNRMDEKVDGYVDQIDDYEALLPATDFSTTNTVKKYIDDKVQLRGGFAGANVLCITDSWGSENVYGVTKCWMHMVCDALHANYIDLHQGSTGFITAPTFLTRAQNYATQNPDMVDKINYIFVCGGNNDVTSEIVTIQGAITNTINYLLSTYTNAIIYYFPQISGADMSKCSVAHSAYNSWYQAAYPSYRALVSHNDAWISRVIFVTKLQYCLVGFDAATYMNPDFIHPKQIAHNYIAQCFLDCVIGGSMLDNGLLTLNLAKVYDNLGNEYTTNSVGSGIRCNVDGTVNMSFRFAISNFSLPSGANAIHIKVPYIFAINNQAYAKNAGIAVISSGNKCAGIVPNMNNVSYKTNGPTDSSEPLMEIVIPLWTALITQNEMLFISCSMTERFTF